MIELKNDKVKSYYFVFYFIKAKHFNLTDSEKNENKPPSHLNMINR